jgi:hypothetical protein
MVNRGGRSVDGKSVLDQHPQDGSKARDRATMNKHPSQRQVVLYDERTTRHLDTQVHPMPMALALLFRTLLYASLTVQAIHLSSAAGLFLALTGKRSKYWKARYQSNTLVYCLGVITAHSASYRKKTR